MTHPIPNKALDDCWAIVGTRGSGKTYTAMGLEERLLNSGARIIHIDPLGVAWGLRLDAEGKKPSRYNIIIFGGPHGDVPINEHAGALIGETAATMAQSCIIDTSLFEVKAKEIRFYRDFMEAFYAKANKEPVHLICDEVDFLAPQNPSDNKEGGGIKLLSTMESIVRRGRIKGIIPWMITQRPAVVNKNILTQADAMVIMKLTAPQDRAAVGLWIRGQADAARAKEIDAAMPTRQQGEGIVWNPTRGILLETKFPEKDTYDSSRTPKRGERKRKPKKLKAIDLGRLKEKLSTVEAEAKANDPVELKKQIADMKRKLAAQVKPVERVIEAVIDKKAVERAYASGYHDCAKDAAHVIEKVQKATRALRGQANDFAVAVDAADRWAAAQSKAKVAAPKELMKPPVTNAFVSTTKNTGPVTSQKKPIPVGAKPSDFNGAESLPSGTLRPLSALLGVHPAGMTESQWGVATGIKGKGSTMKAYRARLKTAGMVDKRDGLWYATDEAVSRYGDKAITLPPPGMELARHWAQKIPGAGKILIYLAEAYPDARSREKIAADQDPPINPAGSTLKAYISRLKTPKLIEEHDGALRASPAIMEG